MTRALVRSLLAAMVLFAWDASGEEAGFKVIVNETNPVASLTSEELSRLFLKKATVWENGAPVDPVDLDEGSRAREAFSRDVHRKSVAGVKSFWLQRIYSGRDVPPPEKESEAAVLAFVKAHPNAIGYVSSTAPTIGVKVLVVHK